ncbi:DUF4350 domain-containing protein [uncultured Psychroserpens sp.]|uniref:DUF4350 domain-containing protein n=1 Tax=uncultured Psychroserpens sp. TaxID=255436 RepID=UPI00262708D3|nr:DUF4350 domain-containing protein [uncultured Psychroserpens sp.]
MSKRVKFYIALISLAILGIIIMEYSKPKEVNWFESYTKHHKIPYGTYVFYEQLQHLFSNETIKDVEQPPYVYLNDNPLVEGTYLFINNSVLFGDAELDKVLEWTAQGNTLFIASNEFDQTLLDTLNLETDLLSKFEVEGDNFQFQLKNNYLDTTTVDFDRGSYAKYFNKIDTLNTSVVGVIKHFKNDVNDDEITLKTIEPICIIKQPFENGEIILSTFPEAFTNYFILNTPNQNYTAGLISYIDNSNSVYFDNYYKSGKVFNASPMYILLNTKALKWAYYIMLIGVIIYVIFEGKRKQRAIPIVKPLRNQTIDFTRTIANMYYEKGKHDDIARHKIQHFLEYIRTHLHLNTNVINDDFIKNLAARSNNSIDDTKHLFKTIEQFKNNKQLNTIELERLNTLIETFKSNNTWKKKT